MSAKFFDELNIPKPTYHLNIGSNSHGKQTGLMLAAIEDALIQEKPDYVLVYGDTNSTLAGALASVKLHIPVAHVEAGLRSFNRQMPEEINRVMTDHISTLLFAPTEVSYDRLLTEGIDKASVVNVGDVMLDAALFYHERNVGRETQFLKLGLEKKSYVLATIHRAENTDASHRLVHIMNALNELTDTYPVILPLHPRTQHTLEKMGIARHKIKCIEPVGYLDMLSLQQHAHCIVTDSGGVQKEAYFNRVPCVTLRDETEWVELVESGWNQLCSPEESFSLTERVLSFQNNPLSKQTQFYGSGDAAEKIVACLSGCL